MKKNSKDKKSDNVPHLENIDIVLVHCNLVHNKIQRNLRVFHALVQNKPLGHLLNILPTNHIHTETFVQIFDTLKYG